MTQGNIRPSSPIPGCFGGLFSQGQSSRQPTRIASESKVQRSTTTGITLEGPSDLIVDPCCDDKQDLTQLSVEELPSYSEIREGLNADERETIRSEIFSHSEELTEISLYLSDHPELAFHEYKAHDKLTSYLKDQGFDVIEHWKIPTSFKASFTNGIGGRTFGLNSEYDALPGIGHACGHNLIAVTGVGALLGMRAAMKKHSISGSVVLIGTPAEEGGAGKARLLELGGYDGIDACMMVHPGHHQAGLGSVTPSLAIQSARIEFFGKTSHAAGAPWDGINALDAANLAYSSISAMRQQFKPTDRVHGIITSGGAAPNIIPDYTAMRYYLRATTVAEVEVLKKKIYGCFEAAAIATGCTWKLEESTGLKDLRNCKPLAEEYASVMNDMFQTPVKLLFHDWSAGGGSTDFGNVTYAMPSCHPHFGIPYTPGRANHTPEFTAKARTPKAHEEAFKAATAVASVGIRFLGDDEFAEESTVWWKDDMENF